MSGFSEKLDAASVASILARVARRRPRVHCLTNTVAQNLTANMLLAFGAVPSMASHPEEVAAVAAGAGAILINLGTLGLEGERAIPKLVGVARERRGRGLGTAILHASLRWAKLKGARQAWVQVEADNAAALALYRRAGFRDVYEYSYRGPDAA